MKDQEKTKAQLLTDLEVLRLRITALETQLAECEQRDGIVAGNVGMLEDLTKEKQAEEVPSYLAAIVESSDDAIIGKTLAGIIISWNAGAKRLYDYTADEVKGCAISLLVPPDQPDKIPDILNRLKRGECIGGHQKPGEVFFLGRISHTMGIPLDRRMSP